MNDVGDAKMRTWSLRFLVLLATDRADQLAWLGESDVDTGSVVEEGELLCRVSEELTKRGVFEVASLRDLQELGRLLGEIDPVCRPKLWAGTLATDSAWDEIRQVARRFLLTTLGDWRQPLPLAPRQPTGHQRDQCQCQ
ncbi:hypothetical protein [Streptomyces sp. NPDC048361]|uniref:hypothetical protein n=1 Tax=Streptomyces sp. NPDC048361 TaxID=3154720 RepID=UPI00343CA062